MPNIDSSLLDLGAFGIVVAGTLAACAVRSGWRDFAAALHAASQLLKPGFDAEANRKALAKAIAAIDRQGAHRASPDLPPDRVLAHMVEACLRHFSLEAARNARLTEQASSEARCNTAVRVFTVAGELAPVFGLVGTLVGFTQLGTPSAGEPMASTMAAIATAVLSTLYGALLAHFVCFPLAGAIERRGDFASRQREILGNWFAERVAASLAPQSAKTLLRGVA